MTGAEYGPRKDEHMRGMIKTVEGDLLLELQYCKPHGWPPYMKKKALAKDSLALSWLNRSPRR